MKNDLFIPMYIDKVKLVDLNSIICGGFNEFSEINISTDNNSCSGIKANMGFNLFKIDAKLDAEAATSRDKKVTGNSKYIQTSSSMLSTIFSELKSNKVKNKIENCKVGDFVDINLKFNVNSILEVLKRMRSIMLFGDQALKFDSSKSKNNGNLNNEIKIMEKLIEMLNNNDEFIECVSETDNYVYVTYLKKEYLYHTQLERIDGYSLNYLAQVVDIRDDYNFCNDTVLSEFNSSYIEEFVKTIKDLNKQEIFSKKNNLLTNNGGKKVVLLDVISITRKGII